MRWQATSSWSAYLVAGLATLAAGILRLIIAGWLGDVAPFLPFVVPVMIAAWFGGIGPGLFATGLSGALSVYLFVPAHHRLRVTTAAELAGAILFLLVGVAISALFEALHRARRRLEIERNRMLESERFHDAIADLTSDYAFSARFEPDGTIVNERLSAGFVRLFGYSREEINARGGRNVVTHPDDREEIDQAMRRLRAGEPVEGQFRALTRDGRVVWLRYRNHPVLDAGGGVTRFYGAVLDITREVAAEESRRMSEAREHARAEELETLLAVAPIPIFMSTDPDCEHVTGNMAADRLLVLARGTNASPTQAESGEHALRLFRDDRELARDERPLETAARGVEVRDQELTCVLADGSVRHILGNAVPLRGPDGSPRGAVGAYVDITDRKHAGEALRSAQEQLRIVIDSMSVFITRCSRDMRYLWVSRAFAEWLERPIDEIVGRPIQEVVGPEIFNTLLPYFRRVLSGETVSFEVEANYRNRGRRWMSAVYTPTFDAGGTPDGWVGVVNDIDERKRTEDSLRQADKKKDEFLATLSHELRNPLAPIRNAVEMLHMSRPPDPDMETAREVIARQVDQMARLLDDLLDVSRIGRDQLSLQKEPVELAVVLASAIETSRPLLESANHEFTFELPPFAIYVDADPARLAQVFSNVLNNSARYTEKGGRIRLGAEVQVGQVSVTVRDNGIGISPEQLPRIFDMFSQASPVRERSWGGLGIGLSLVRRLVELHRGTIVVRSEGPGRGTEVTIRLPTVPVPAAATPPSPEPDPAWPGKRRILVVDDNVDVADSLAAFLRKSGHELAVAYDGLEAVKEAASFQPDVILLDLGLPRLNGYEVARRIRETSSGSTAALVAITGWGQEEDRRRSEAAGFDRHLVKPVDPARIMRMIHELSSRSRTGG